MFSKKAGYQFARNQYRATPKPTTGGRIFVITVIVVLALLYMVNRGNAQDADPLNCDAAARVDLTAIIVEAAGKLEAETDPVAWLAQVRGLRNGLAMMDAACMALSFSAERDGGQPVLGPLSFPNGVWKVTLTTPGFAIIQFTTLEGDCDDNVTAYLFSEMAGDAETGASKVFTTSGNCSALVTLESTEAPWTLNFELVKAGD